MQEKILVIGSSGQIGTELIVELRKIYGNHNVIASDIKFDSNQVINYGPFEQMDVLNKSRLENIVRKHKISQIYLLAAMLSATAEKNITKAWELNMRSHSNILELAKNRLIKKIFWPSSIAVFGPTTPKENTPQYTIMDPNTVYGISKHAGELWNQYYYNKYNVDIRSIRYPGLIGWKSEPGGGTTDYAVDIFHHAIQNNKYECFLSKDTTLPMMYMSDAIKGAIQLMETDHQKIKIRSSYNISGFSVSPKQLADEILKHLPKFKISFKPDFRQEIANSWPSSINDNNARKDWGWKPEFNLQKITEDMIKNLREKNNIPL